MRDLGYRDVWENCYHSLYGIKAAKMYAEPAYCYKGYMYLVKNNQPIRPDYRCPDWYKCKGRDEVINKHKIDPRST